MLHFPEFGAAAWAMNKTMYDHTKLPKSVLQVCVLVTGSRHSLEFSDNPMFEANFHAAVVRTGQLMRIMDPVDLRGVDLNLLVSLRVLLTLRHVTRSAERLGMTQPAMSASLARSRTLFRDKLLVRGPQGLVLTPRAEQILEQLNKIMEVTERLIALPGEFTPETCNRTFTLMGSDFVEFILLPSLMAKVASEAPNLQIAFKSPDRRSLEAMLANRKLDLVVG